MWGIEGEASDCPCIRIEKDSRDLAKLLTFVRRNHGKSFEIECMHIDRSFQLWSCHSEHQRVVRSMSYGVAPEDGAAS